MGGEGLEWRAGWRVALGGKGIYVIHSTINNYLNLKRGRGATFPQKYLLSWMLKLNIQLMDVEQEFVQQTKRKPKQNLKSPCDSE